MKGPSLRMQVIAYERSNIAAPDTTVACKVRTFHAHSPAPSPAKPEEDRRFQKEFSGRCRRQCRRTPKTTKVKVIELELNSEKAPRASAATRPKPQPLRTPKKEILRTLHAPAPPPAQNRKRVANFGQNSEAAPRARANAHPKPRKGRRFQNNAQDAPRASAATHPKQLDSREF